MEHLAYDIRCGDFTSAGAASRDLKQHLKRIGAESDAVRRAMIAAYEAEMNVVIHARGGGRLEAAVSDGQLDVDVVDEGPGMTDVDAAMREGWSTASAEARALGFGAGMGLPNILRNSDRLRVTSAPGAGTRVSFTVSLRPEAADQGARPSSLGVDAALCKECRHCLVACPTAAIRVRDARPHVLDHLCIDCTACIAACAPRALTMKDVPGALAGGDVLVVPPALLAGFGDHSVPEVVEELLGLGYDEVVSVHRYEDDLRRELIDLATTGDGPAPVISPVCPAVVSLVEVKFPSLLDHLAPLASPWEAAQLELDGRSATFAVSCPSQRTALLSQRPTAQRDTVTAAAVREAVLPRLSARALRTPGDASPQQARRSGRPARGQRRRPRARGARGGRGRPAARRRGRGAVHLRRRLLRHPAARRGHVGGGLALGRRRRRRSGRRRQPHAHAAVPRPARHPPGRGHGDRHPQARPARRREPGAARSRLRRLRRAHVRRARRGRRHGARHARALSIHRPCGGGEREMRLEDIASELGFAELTPEVSGAKDADIERGYASDLLSDVLAHAPEGGLLVTLQVHLNVIAVASHAELAAVVFAGGRKPEDDVLGKAVAEGLALYSSPADTFDVVGRLYALGVKGTHA